MEYSKQPKNVKDFLDQEAKKLKEISAEICKDNQCTEDNHNCESSAYYTIKTDENDIISNLNRVDICASDYLTQQVDIVLSLPFDGNGKDLLDELNHYDDKEI